MKIFLGILLNLILLTVAVLGVLAVWDIYPVSGEILSKSAITLVIVLAAFALLVLNFTLFFKKEKYKKTGNKAHLMD